MGDAATPLLRGGALAKCCGGGVFANMFVNTPLHPSQEGNRTAQALNSVSFIIFLIAKHFK
jgi:hypothetical protein